MSWLSSDFIPDVTTPKTGTLAGTGIADILFLVAFSRVVLVLSLDGLLRRRIKMLCSRPCTWDKLSG